MFFQNRQMKPGGFWAKGNWTSIPSPKAQQAADLETSGKFISVLFLPSVLIQPIKMQGPYFMSFLTWCIKKTTKKKKKKAKNYKNYRMKFTVLHYWKGQILILCYKWPSCHQLYEPLFNLIFFYLKNNSLKTKKGLMTLMRPVLAKNASPPPSTLLACA